MILAGVLAIQTVLFIVDEFVFHHRRTMPRWERIGHPVDALSVVLCTCVAAFAPPQAPWFGIFAGLAILSCALVTKDEWVHAKYCDPAEHWLHAVLFVLHPVILGLVAWNWVKGFPGISQFAVWGLLLVSSGAGLFQLVYWNIYVRE